MSPIVTIVLFLIVAITWEYAAVQGWIPTYRLPKW